MLDVLSKTEDTAPTVPLQEAPRVRATRRWSSRRTLLFIMATCSLMWGLIILGLYEIASAFAPS